MLGVCTNEAILMILLKANSKCRYRQLVKIFFGRFEPIPRSLQGGGFCPTALGLAPHLGLLALSVDLEEPVTA